MNMISFCEEDLFPGQLESFVSPTIQKPQNQLLFKGNHIAEEMKAIVKVSSQDNTAIMLRLKTNISEDLNNTRIEYSSDKGKSYKQLYYPIPEKIEETNRVEEIHFRVKHLSKTSFPQFCY